MRTVLVEGPDDEPLTVDEMRMHLRNPEQTTNDAEIEWFIQTAREQAEHKLGRALITQTWDVYLDNFYWANGSNGYPYGNNGHCYASQLVLPYPPLQSVTSVQYLNSDNVLTTVDDTGYTVSTAEPYGTISLASGASWPSVYGAADAVVVRIVVGWPSKDDVPFVIKTWMKLMVAAMYENRSLQQEREPFLTPFAERLLDRYRILGV